MWRGILKLPYFRRRNSYKRLRFEYEFSRNENYCDFIFEWFKGTDVNVNYCFNIFNDWLSEHGGPKSQILIEEYDYYVAGNLFD
jgi:hypothetical protein